MGFWIASRGNWVCGVKAFVKHFHGEGISQALYISPILNVDLDLSEMCSCHPLAVYEFPEPVLPEHEARCRPGDP